MRSAIWVAWWAPSSPGNMTGRIGWVPGRTSKRASRISASTDINSAGVTSSIVNNTQYIALGDVRICY